MLKRLLIVGLTVAFAVGAAQAAAPVDPPPPNPVTRPEIERWATAWGMKTSRFNLVSFNADGAFYSPQLVVPRMNPGKHSATRMVTVQLRFERFRPLLNAAGKEVRSETATLDITCGIDSKKVRLTGQPIAYVGHALAGGQAGKGEFALWAQFAPNGTIEAPAPMTVGPLIRACFAGL